MSENPILKQIYDFVRNPKKTLESYNDSHQLSFSDKVMYVFKLVSLMIFLAFVIGFIAGIFISATGYQQDQNNQVMSSLDSIPGWLSVLFVIVIGPFNEELSFRFFLSTKKWIFLLGSFFYFSFLFVTLAPYFISDNVFVPYTLAVVGGLALIAIVLSIVIKKEFLANTVTKYLNILVYFSALSFGLIHITNYTDLENYWWIAPLLVLPQLIVGFLLPLVRIRFGFFWSFLTHATYNFTLAIYTLGLLAGPGNVSQLANDPQNAQTIIDNLNSTEKLYYNLISIASTLAFAIVALLFIDIVREYVIWWRKDRSKQS
jgi:ABC-type proline/glycine betaine transport system permease subunit